MHAMTNPLITLVGRASRLQRHADHASFLLAVNACGDRPPLAIECKAWYQRHLETFEAIDNGGLVGVIGRIPLRSTPGTAPVMDLTCLEILGKPRSVHA